MFETKVHVLGWPIDNNKVKEVAFQLLTMGSYKKIQDDKNSDREYIKACTRLTDERIKQLVAPDYKAIKNITEDLLTNSAETFFKKTNKFNPDAPDLLMPFVGDDGVEKKAYKLKPPTVETTDLMDSYETEWERTIFISATCTGFSPGELEQMSMPDWMHLQERLLSFLSETTDFFHSQT